MLLGIKIKKKYLAPFTRNGKFIANLVKYFLINATILTIFGTFFADGMDLAETSIFDLRQIFKRHVVE